MDVLTRIETAGVVPVVVIENAADAVPAARALLAGGVDVMEITFRTDAAAESIRAVAQECPEMLVGAGTVLTLEQCRLAVSLGAKFIISAGLDEEVVRWCVENGVPVLPGVATPTEIMAAMRLGLRVVKFFPANVYGGLSAMKALSAPFGGIKFMPTGGLNENNILNYLSFNKILACGGSFMVTGDLIEKEDYGKITELSRAAVDIVRKCRQNH